MAEPATVSPRLRDQRPFLLLFTGQSLSSAGSMLLYFGLLIGVFAATHSARVTVAVFVAESVPMALLSLRAGRLADVRDRRRLIVGADLLRALLLVPLFLPAVLHRTVLLCVVVACQSAVNAVFMPAFQALLPSTVPRELLPAANSGWSTSRALVQLVAPLVGAALFAAIGFRALVLADLLSFVVSAGATSLVRVVQQPVGPDVEDAALGGFAIVRRSPLLRWLALGELLFAASQPLTTPVLVPFLQGTLHASPTFVGLTLTVLSVATLAGAPLAGRVVRRAGLRVATLTSGLGIALFLTGFAAAPTQVVALVLIGASGVPLAWFEVGLNTWTQLAAPPHQLGRVYGLIFAGNAATSVVASVLPLTLIAVLHPRGCLYLAALLLLAGTLTATRAALPAEPMVAEHGAQHGDSRLRTRPGVQRDATLSEQPVERSGT